MVNINKACVHRKKCVDPAYRPAIHCSMPAVTKTAYEIACRIPANLAQRLRTPIPFFAYAMTNPWGCRVLGQMKPAGQHPQGRPRAAIYDQHVILRFRRLVFS